MITTIWKMGQRLKKEDTSLTMLTCRWTLLIGTIVFLFPSTAECQYEDVRCKCVCPVPSVVVSNNNSRTSNRKLYIGNVLPSECNCDYVVLPQLEANIQNKAKEFCPLCECKYESRNTSVIRFFVIFILGLISFLTVYMVFLMILDPWIHKRNVRSNYSEHVNEEVSLEEPGAIAPPTPKWNEQTDPPPKGVFNRVSYSQTKWKLQVQQQRRNIYDDHTILN